MKKENLGRYLQFALVVLAAGSIYPLVYLKAQYQETILEVFNMTLNQMNIIYSVLGLVFLAGYLPSGILSDKFSAKNLLAVSLLGTSLGGFWFAQVPNYEHVIAIFTMWGVFSVITFWSAHIKVVKMLAAEGEDGRFFGILDSGRGLVEAVLASIALAVFTAILKSGVEVGNKKEALESIIYMYSSVLLVTSILVFIFIKADKVTNESGGVNSEEGSFKFSDLGKVFKNKYIYLHGIILFAGYTAFWTNYYYGGFLQASLGLTPVTVGSMMVVVLWMRPLGGLVGGFLADKIGNEIAIAGSLFCTCVCLVIMATAPSTTPTFILGILVSLTGFCVYMVRGTYWSLLGKSKIDVTIMGTAIGVISFIGYLPDIIIPQMNTYIWDVFGEQEGYQAYFLVSAVVGFIGVIFSIVYRKAQMDDVKEEQVTKEKTKEINRAPAI